MTKKYIIQQFLSVTGVEIVKNPTTRNVVTKRISRRTAPDTLGEGFGNVHGIAFNVVEDVF